MRVINLAFFWGIALTGFATQLQAECVQISPHPNPFASTASNNDRLGCNRLDPFDNFGTLMNSGTLDNDGTLRNFGMLINTGTLNNFGELANIQSRSGRVMNTGTLNNFGNVGGYGSTRNAGILNNYGRFDSGDFGENIGVVNNYSGATLTSAQRYTNDGVFNNALGATVRPTVLWINNGKLNNNGALSFEKAGAYLSNHGIVNNNNGAVLVSKNELRSNGVLSNEGTLENIGRIITSGQMLVFGSGKVIGSGSYHQLAGGTFIYGFVAQARLNIEGGILEGGGTIESWVTLDGGTVAPGHSIGEMTILGEYSQTESGRFAAEIGDPRKGVGNDLLKVFGTASLDGQLQIIIHDDGGDPFVLREGDSFDILHAESVAGEFRNVSSAPLGNGLAWKILYLKDAYGVTDVVRLVVTRGGNGIDN